MEPGSDGTRSFENVAHVARVLAEEFGVDEVLIVGSQALLVHQPDVLRALRNSAEIDAAIVVPDGSDPTGELASHDINAGFGEGSLFHRTHGFFIDGVDLTTAVLPADWREEAVERKIELRDGRSVTVLAPSIPDLVSAKLARGLDKDLAFASLCLATGLTRPARVSDSIGRAMEPAPAERALRLLERAVADQRREMDAARRATGILSKGPVTNPLNDADAYAAVRRSISDRGPGR